MKASKLIKQEEVTVDFSEEGVEATEDDLLHLTINAGAMTPKMIQDFTSASDEDVQPLVDGILGVIVKWDLMDDQGEVIPLTQDGIENQPIVVLGAILTKTGEALADRAKEQGKA